MYYFISQSRLAQSFGDLVSKTAVNLRRRKFSFASNQNSYSFMRINLYYLNKNTLVLNLSTQNSNQTFQNPNSISSKHYMLIHQEQWRHNELVETVAAVQGLPDTILRLAKLAKFIVLIFQRKKKNDMLH